MSYTDWSDMGLLILALALASGREGLRVDRDALIAEMDLRATLRGRPVRRQEGFNG